MALVRVRSTTEQARWRAGIQWGVNFGEFVEVDAAQLSELKDDGALQVEVQGEEVGSKPVPLNLVSLPPLAEAFTAGPVVSAMMSPPAPVPVDPNAAKPINAVELPPIDDPFLEKAKAKAEGEKLAAEKAEGEKLAAEKAEAEKAEAEKADAEAKGEKSGKRK